MAHCLFYRWPVAPSPYSFTPQAIISQDTGSLKLGLEPLNKMGSASLVLC